MPDRYTRPATVEAVQWLGHNAGEILHLWRRFQPCLNSFGDPVAYCGDNHVVVELGGWACLSEAGPEVWDLFSFAIAHKPAPKCTCDQVDVSLPGGKPGTIRGQRNPDCPIHTEEDQ